MPDITITIDDEARKILKTRAKRNIFTLREQIEDIIRKSAIRYKNSGNFRRFRLDDKLIEIFSRDKRGGRKKSTKKKSRTVKITKPGQKK